MYRGENRRKKMFELQCTQGIVLHPIIFFNVGHYLEYKGGYAEIVIDSDADASLGVERYSLSSP